MDAQIGIEKSQKTAVAEQLAKLLADSYTLYLKTHGFHWNVTGPRFRELHLMFEEHYTELAEAVDDIAERIRTLGEVAPASYAQFGALSSVTEESGVPDENDMIRQLAEGHEQVVATARAALKAAQQAEDESSIALISDRMRVHEKTSWMLRSLLS